jgi:cullin-4
LLAYASAVSPGYDPEFGKGDEMFKDLSLSRDLMVDFHKGSSRNDKAVSVMILQYSCWPFPPKTEKDADLPSSVSPALHNSAT